MNSDDRPDENRYCGASLINNLGGRGFGTTPNCLGMNDDGSSNAIDITPYFPMGLRFFTPTPHTQLFVNTNGNITFSAAVPAFTPSRFPVSTNPMIAPFWADVDIRTRPNGGDVCNGPGNGVAVRGPACHNPASNGVWWHFEEGRAVFTWHEVSYFECHDDRRNSFQLILDAVEGCGGNVGDFNVEFRFNRCEWDTGDASEGEGGFAVRDGRTCTTNADCPFTLFPLRAAAECHGGFCQTGIAAQSGFDAGNMMNFVEIVQSRDTRDISRKLCEESNVDEPGVWRFTLRDGAVECPEAGMPCPTNLEGACSEGRISCTCSGASCTTMCVPLVQPRDERCNAIDDDCDGEVDDMGGGTPICDSFQQCVLGRCIDSCFEGGCGDGYTCTDSGCVETACVDVTCPEGQRCRGGDCIPACDGVICPAPLSCVGGACVDTCAGIGCDECTACDEGSCVVRCDQGGSCGAGEQCDPATGRCVDQGCAGMTCNAGTVCRDGACVDACVGAVCPEGEMCQGGACVPMVRPDAGMPMPRDASVPVPGVDSGTPAPIDAGAPDGGRRRGPPTTGDGCCTVAAGAERGRQGGALLATLALGVLMIARARRRRTMRG